MRLFVAFDLNGAIRARLKHFADALRESAPTARWVGDESFHVTLKFIGNASSEQAGRIKATLAAIASPPVTLQVRGYGFFPNATSPRVFWAGVQPSEPLARLAHQIDAVLATLGIPAERAPYHPHITLARAGSSSSRLNPKDRQNKRYECLQDKLSAMPQPDFGEIIAQEFILYESRLSPKGSIYTKVERFPLPC
jgi:RNA 2',3'-cyclic 3'-phosphodiesterase